MSAESAHSGPERNERPWDTFLELSDDLYPDGDPADLPQCEFVGENGSGLVERCLRRQGHEGPHFGMGTDD